MSGRGEDRGGWGRRGRGARMTGKAAGQRRWQRKGIVVGGCRVGGGW